MLIDAHIESDIRSRVVPKTLSGWRPIKARMRRRIPDSVAAQMRAEANLHASGDASSPAASRVRSACTASLMASAPLRAAQSVKAGPVSAATPRHDPSRQAMSTSAASRAPPSPMPAKCDHAICDTAIVKQLLWISGAKTLLAAFRPSITDVTWPLVDKSDAGLFLRAHSTREASEAARLIPSKQSSRLRC
eukprot:scaffold55567_cov28-Tisochrysis_lutea.AAC.2